MEFERSVLSKDYKITVYLKQKKKTGVVYCLLLGRVYYGKYVVYSESICNK